MNIERLDTIIGDNVRLLPEEVLCRAPTDLDSVVVVGITKDGKTFISSTEGGGNALLILELGKKLIIETAEKS